MTRIILSSLAAAAMLAMPADSSADQLKQRVGAQSGEVRQQINQITSYIDGSRVYGSSGSAQSRARARGAPRGGPSGLGPWEVNPSRVLSGAGTRGR